MRFEDRHSTAEGYFKKSLLIDPAFLLYASDKWQLDLRGRFQFKVSDELGWLYFRPRPRLMYHFNLRGKQSSWFVYNDFYIQLDKENRRQHLAQNMFAGGLRCNLNSRSSLDFFYLVFSSKSSDRSVWQHFHQPALAYNLSY